MRAELLFSHHNNNNKTVISEIKDVLTNLTVVNISQYIGLSNNHLFHPKLMPCYVSIISQ